MNRKELLEKTQNHIYALFSEEATGHDYYHMERVVNNAKKILRYEKADPFLVEMAAWLHDLGDAKLHQGVDLSEQLIGEFLEGSEVDEDIIKKIQQIVSEVSFSKNEKTSSLEAKIVQDADRLDAIGAVGIARCFAYGGSVGNLLYNPKSVEKKSSSVQHFHDKLFKLKNLMNTETAKKMAEERHVFMEGFIEQFYQEVR
ncbi:MULTISPECIES: HD domain-containing protein [Weeksella]|uniref:HD domain-containing protein n=1 Tax=Weeksella TaxID=1013 RepID=UPI0008A5F28D|nr:MULTISPECIES: HD domain-containing protein [Weeksella]MDK7375317.1 HD domain-containing protein [Weeksella virosa]OFM84762.1 metal-dependent phosphohydrolase [Weeksella sp. HMSC059D05]